MIQKINYALTRIFDILLIPFHLVGDFGGILFLSVLTSLIVLVGYKYLSSPRGIKAAKDKIKASIFAIRLYKDFWKVILASFFKSLYYIVKYFALNMVPLVVIVPLLFPLFVQMDVRYGMRAFEPGEEFVIKAGFSENPYDLDIQLLEDNHIRAKMNPVFINAFKDSERNDPLREADWKVEAGEAGRANIRIQVKGAVYEKSLWIGEQEGAFSQKKFGSSSIEHFIYPVEPLFSHEGPLEYLYVDYPGRNVTFLFIKIHWLIYYLILVLVIVLALRKRFGVEF